MQTTQEKKNSGLIFKADPTKTKLEVAKNALQILIRQLHVGDSFSLIVFNSDASVIQNLENFDKIDRFYLRSKIEKFRARGYKYL